MSVDCVYRSNYACSLRLHGISTLPTGIPLLHRLSLKFALPHIVRFCDVITDINNVENFPLTVRY